MSLGGLYLEGLIHGGAYFRNFTVTESAPRNYPYNSSKKNHNKNDDAPLIARNTLKNVTKNLSK